MELTLAISEVYKARHKRTGRLVALKKILMHNEKEGVSTSKSEYFSIPQTIVLILQ